MVVLTDQRQWRLALGMVIADPASHLSPGIRQAGCRLLYDEHAVPPSWKRLIQTYLE